MANAITVGRVCALFVVIWLMYTGDAGVVQASAAAIAVIIAADALDGWVARRRNETGQFGAIFDVVGDRIVENALWIVFAHLGLVPLWVPLLVVTRGFLVDGLRSASYEDGMTPFGEKNVMRSTFTTWLTAGRPMRALYGGAKALAFVFLAGLYAWLTTPTAGTWIGAVYQHPWVRVVGWTAVWLSVALAVIRGIPAIADSVAYIREKDARVASAGDRGAPLQTRASTATVDSGELDRASL